MLRKTRLDPTQSKLPVAVLFGCLLEMANTVARVVRAVLVRQLAVLVKRAVLTGDPKPRRLRDLPGHVAHQVLRRFFALYVPVCCWS